MSLILLILLQGAALAYACLGGVFLAFSDFIMRSLDRSDGIDAMQAINREVYRWIFMALFIGMAPLSLLVAVYGPVQIGGTPGGLMMASGLIYVVGCFGVTLRFNVPMNTALAGMSASADATRSYWRTTYLPRWTFWNSVRAAACGVSAALLLVALSFLAR